jgi:hypothetical protein
MAVAQAIHWFNPIAWLVFRKMRLERELACDQIVLQSRAATDPKAYGQTLLKLLHDFTPIPSAPALVGIAEDKHSATKRLSQIAQFTPGRSSFSKIGVAVLLVIALIGLTSAQTERIQAPVTDDTAASISSKKPKSASDPERRAKNIEALERELERQKKAVDQSLAELNKLRTELGIVEVTDGTPSDTAAQEIATLSQSYSEHRQKTFENNAILEHLKRLPRADLRNALPTMLKPADELLNRYLADLGKAEQDHVTLSGDRADEHPEVRRTTELIAKINEQIEARIDGILLGLEARKKATDEMLQALEAEIEQTKHRNARRQEFYVPFFKAKRELDHNQRVLDSIFMRLLAEKVDSQVPK